MSSSIKTPLQRRAARASAIFAIYPLAEAGGFEPPVPVKVQWFSRPPPSAAQARLQNYLSNFLFQ